MEENKEEISINNEQNVEINEKKPKKKGNPILVILIVLAIAVAGSIGYVVKLMLDEDKGVSSTKSSIDKTKVASEYRINSNGLEKFDLAFLKLENKNKNMIYSPLSIKYALRMMQLASNGDTKAQITGVIGDYRAKKYTNSKNMSFSNTLFVKDSYKNKINNTYIDNLKNSYNGSVVFDSFNNANTINSTINKQTLGLIDSLYNDQEVNAMNYILTNALAIDMEWDENKFQSYMYVWYQHETLGESQATNSPCDGIEGYVDAFSGSGIYQDLKFNDKNVNALRFETYANNYDAVNAIGKENIVSNISNGYKEYMINGKGESDPYTPTEEEVNKYVNKYLEELNSGYQKIESSTNLKFYVDDDFNVYSKDLKEYDGVKLEYVAVMPKKLSLKEYVDNISTSSLNELISKVKSNQDIDSFEPGYLTILEGDIPVFKYDYDLSENLKNILNQMGIVDIFDKAKADMSNLTAEKNSYIDSFKHKATIEFSNEGIKAAAISGGGAGNACGPGYNYLYNVPVKKINITFDKPYLYLIRDKNTGEVWFVGTVYEPTTK